MQTQSLQGKPTKCRIPKEMIKAAKLSLWNRKTSGPVARWRRVGDW